MSRIQALNLAVVVAFFGAAAPESSAEEAGEAELRDHMRTLVEGDEEARQAALEELVESRDGRVARFLEAYQLGQIHRWNDRLVLCREFVTDEDGTRSAPLSDPLSGQPLRRDGERIVVPKGELETQFPDRRARRKLTEAARILALFAPDRAGRLAAIEELGDSRDPRFLPYLQDVHQAASDPKIRFKARESILLIRLAGDVPGQSREDRMAAARELGEKLSLRAAPLLESRLEALDSTSASGDPAVAQARQIYREALEAIASYRQKVRVLGYLFSGLSLGSILVLMALGLSIIFGQMGVINMAHGELMMIGAYATYEMQRLFGHSVPENPVDWYFVAALPAAFLAAALVGYLIEVLVVRHLYGRPLETLLATWGVGLVLIQAVRLRYGDNIGINSPTWFVGSFEAMRGLQLPYNRCFIIALCIGCVAASYWLINRTKLGLLVRATVQKRETAEGLGVNTRRIDGYTFAFGAGLAGVAGCALTLIGGVTPDMGQNYIVDSFLVVVTGGVGELAGAVWAGMGIGMLNKLLEPVFGTIWGKVLILVLVILFIQCRPAGLFPPKGRETDV